MRYRSQAVAYPYFAVALLLFGLQIAFGLLAAVKYLGPDPLINLLPFDRVKAIHTNLLIVWVLTGFMGAAYHVVPEESGTELWSQARLHRARPLGTHGPYRRDRLRVRLDRGQQAPRAALPAQAPHRGGDADVPRQSPAHDPAGGPLDNDGSGSGRRADS